MAVVARALVVVEVGVVWDRVKVLLVSLEVVAEVVVVLVVVVL